MRILAVVGTRPNFIKMAPVVRALRALAQMDVRLIHTGQHFDRNMSQVFFDDLGLPEPDVNLDVGALSPWAQSGRIIERLGDLIATDKPDWVIVPGDVNSTLAAAIAAIRAGTRLAHLESGLRSGDRTMPEELNRIAADHLADLLFVTEQSGLDNLAREGIPAERARFVGNTMIDTLLASREIAKRSDIHDRLGVAPGTFALVTMHRPATVDNRAGLERLLEILEGASARLPVVFPIHPRTRANLDRHGLGGRSHSIRNLVLAEPLGYLEFLSLMDGAKVVLTDSGGIQEETTVLGVPCLTLRENTERPVTCSAGTNRLVGTDPANVLRALDEALVNPPAGNTPENWDGKASRRVAEVFTKEGQERGEA